MKCAVIALALLFSAQALKMDNPKKGAIARWRGKMDEHDRKHGRPLRTQAAKAGVTSGGMKEATVDGHLGAAIYYNVEDHIEDCKGLHYSSYDVMECAAAALDGDAGFSEEYCALIDLYFTDAEYIANEIAAAWVASGGADGDLEAYIESVAKLSPGQLTVISEESQKAYNVDAEMVGAILDWFGNSGTVGDMQDLIDEYEYCWDVMPELMGNELYEREFHDRFSLSNSDVLAEAEAALTASAGNDWMGTDVNGNSVTDAGDAIKALYDYIIANEKNLPQRSHAEHIRMRGKKARARNRKAAKSGKFKRYKNGDRK